MKGRGRSLSTHKVILLTACAPYRHRAEPLTDMQVCILGCQYSSEPGFISLVLSFRKTRTSSRHFRGTTKKKKRHPEFIYTTKKHLCNLWFLLTSKKFVQGTGWHGEQCKEQLHYCPGQAEPYTYSELKCFQGVSGSRLSSLSVGIHVELL